MKNDTGEVIMGCLGWIVFSGAIIVFGSIVGGWALSTLWNWFIVSVFNLPVLSIGQAIGISMVIGYVMPKPNSTSSDKNKQTMEKIKETVGVVFVVPILSVGIGWVVLQFIR